MLPGFRFLFAAIMLSMSLLVFGLGAAALLRAAHESFASNSSWRAAPEVAFAQQTEPTMPMLAALRVDSVAEKAPEPAKVVATPAEPVPALAESATSPQAAALSPAETPAIDAPKPDAAPAQTPVVETPPAPEVAPAPKMAATTVETKTAAATDETRTAAPADEKTAASVASTTSSGNGEPAMPQPTPAIAAPADPAAAASTTTTASTAAEVSTTTAASAAAPEASSAATKIATLGGPPVDIVTDAPVKEKTAKPEHAKDDQSAIKKRRILHRRRLAARARLLAAQQLQLQQANPFAQPLVPTATTTPQQRR